jgi:hypothetical protein
MLAALVSIDFSWWLIIILLLLFFGIPALRYVINPILMFFGSRFDLSFQVIVFDPATKPMPEEVRRYFDQTYRPLVHLGFELVGCAYTTGAIKNVGTFGAYYVNRVTGERAGTLVMTVKAAISGTRFLQFTADFSDGFLVQTNDSDIFASFAQVSREHTTQFPDVHDISLLYRLHRFLVVKHRPGQQPVCRLDTEFHGDLAAHIRAILEQRMADQVEAGTMRRTTSDFRPSVLGACRFAWQELWPMKAIRLARRRRGAEAILMEYYAAQATGQNP